MSRFFKFFVKESVRAIAIPLFVFGALAAALAFSEPLVGPTGGTVYAPVNTGGTAQTKSGNFTTSGTLTGNIVNGTTQMCLAGSCISSWPGGGGLSGGVANYVPKWTSATTLSGTSNLYDNGTNVGIGTVSPSEKLHISGSVYVGSNWYKAGNITSVNNAIGLWGAEGGVLSGFASGRAVAIGQTTSGYAGLGISSGVTAVGSFYYDHLGNSIVMQSYGSGRNLVLATDFGTSNINFSTNGNVNRMTITSSGNVGIGTTAPGEKLEVAGDIKVGNLRVVDVGLYGARTGPGIGTNLGAIGVQGNYFNVGDQSGTTYAPVYASDYWINNAGRWASSFSDIRLKKNTQPLVNTLDKLLNIHGISFNWNEAYAALGHPNDKRQIGVIAQELEIQFPELVTASSANGYKSVNYEGFTAVLLEGMKEQQKEIDSLKARIEALEKK